MDFSWTEEQSQLKERSANFAREIFLPGPETFNEKAFREKWKAGAKFGLQGLMIPEKLGGTNVDLLSGLLMMEGLGYGSEDNGLIFSINAQTWSCVRPLVEFGTDKQKEKYLPGVASGDFIFAHAMTEPGSGSDAFGLTTTAKTDPKGFVLNGAKTFVTNGPVANAFLVFAKTGTRVTGFLVDAGTKGLSVGHNIEKMGLKSASICEITFNNCLVSESDVLGEVGGGNLIFGSAMVEERIFTMAAHIGRMERQLEQATSRAKERKQFGKPIGEFQAISHALVEMKMNLETSRLLLYKAAWLRSLGKTALSESSMAKLHVTESWVKNSLAAMKIHGGYGYMTECGLERQLRDSIGSLFYSGTSEIQRNIIAGTMD